MRAGRRYNARSTMTASAMTDAASKNQIGQPAAWMMANKVQSPDVWNQRLQTVSASLPPGKESATRGDARPSAAIAAMATGVAATQALA